MDSIAPYLAQLRKLEFVHDAQILSIGPSEISGTGSGYEVEITTPTSSKRFHAQVVPTHFNLAVASKLITDFRKLHGSWLLAAPTISNMLAEYLADNQVNYVDLQGNCRLNIDGDYIAQLSGRRGPRPESATARAIGPSGYRILFTLLAEPELVSQTVRTIGAAAGTSHRAAAILLGRLAEERMIVKTGLGYRWIPERLPAAVSRCLFGYSDVLRPKLLLGRYRTAEISLEKLEHEMELALADTKWAWGGSTAGYRLTGYYKGSRAIVHLSHLPPSVPQRIRALPDPSGQIWFIKPPSFLGMNGALSHTAHPLLVYFEMMIEGNDRAREAAAIVAQRYLEPLGL